MVYELWLSCTLSTNLSHLWLVKNLFFFFQKRTWPCFLIGLWFAGFSFAALFGIWSILKGEMDEKPQFFTDLLRGTCRDLFFFYPKTNSLLSFLFLSFCISLSLSFSFSFSFCVPLYFFLQICLFLQFFFIFVSLTVRIFLWNCTNIGTSRDVPDVPRPTSVPTFVLGSRRPFKLCKYVQLCTPPF